MWSWCFEGGFVPLYDRCVVGGGWSYVRIQPVKRVPLNCSEDKSHWFWL